MKEGESCNNRLLLVHAKENCEDSVAGMATVYALECLGIKFLWWLYFCCRQKQFKD